MYTSIIVVFLHLVNRVEQGVGRLVNHHIGVLRERHHAARVTRVTKNYHLINEGEWGMAGGEVEQASGRKHTRKHASARVDSLRAPCYSNAGSRLPVTAAVLN